MYYRKIIRIGVSSGMLQNFFTYGIRKIKIVENPLPEDAIMFHSIFDPSTSVFDMFFYSASGQELPECGDIMSIKRMDIIFKTE